jgi:hypothetical protein
MCLERVSKIPLQRNPEAVSPVPRLEYPREAVAQES